MDGSISVNGPVTVKEYDAKGGTLNQANRQWASRPADQRFDSLDALLAATRDYRKRSATATTHASKLRASAEGGDLILTGESGATARPTHYGFGQLASRASAPAGYLRRLPAKLAADCINEGLTERGRSRDEGAPESLLLRRDASGAMELHAMLSDSYKRVWNHEVAETLVSLREHQPAWDFPTAFKSASGTHATWGAEKRIPVAYASDHDMFVFLTDQERVIEVEGSRLFRGFFVENSEVGAASFRMTMFLYDMVCSNVIVWGARNVREISMRHVGSIRKHVLGPDSAVLPALAAYGGASVTEQAAQIRTAQRTMLGDGKEKTVAALLSKRIPGLTESNLGAAYDAAEQADRYGAPSSVWGMVNGLTEYSQRTAFADERIALDRAAGRVMEIVF